MRRIRFSPRAESDFEAIGDFIAIGDPVRARTFVDELRALHTHA
ncbi:MAG TPA: type II toxin-antitoxin system RelE/ParE family toxin [Beijerinckiaceae bacterium]